MSRFDFQQEPTQQLINAASRQGANLMQNFPQPQTSEEDIFPTDKTRVDMPVPIGPGPSPSVSGYKPNIIDKLSNMVPDTGPTGVAKGVYKGMDEGLFGLLPSGNYERTSPEISTGTGMGYIADYPFAVGKGYKAFNKLTHPLRKALIKHSATRPLGGKNASILDAQFARLEAGQGGKIPINYDAQGPGKWTAGRYSPYQPWSLRMPPGMEEISMYVPDNWAKMPQYYKGAPGTLVHEKVHALQGHLPYGRTRSQYVGGGQHIDEVIPTVVDLGKGKSWGANPAIPPSIKGFGKGESLLHRIKILAKDSFHPDSPGWYNKEVWNDEVREHLRYLQKEKEIEARIGSVWARGGERGKGQLGALESAGFSKKQIEGWLWDFDKAMNKREKGVMYDKLFNTRESLLQQYKMDAPERDVINYFKDLEENKKYLK